MLNPFTDKCPFCCYNITIRFTANFISFNVNFVKYNIVWCLRVFLWSICYGFLDGLTRIMYVLCVIIWRKCNSSVSLSDR